MWHLMCADVSQSTLGLDVSSSAIAREFSVNRLEQSLSTRTMEI